MKGGEFVCYAGGMFGIKERGSDVTSDLARARETPTFRYVYPVGQYVVQRRPGVSLPNISYCLVLKSL